MSKIDIYCLDHQNQPTFHLFLNHTVRLKLERDNNYWATPALLPVRRRKNGAFRPDMPRKVASCPLSRSSTPCIFCPVVVGPLDTRSCPLCGPYFQNTHTLRQQVLKRRSCLSHDANDKNGWRTTICRVKIGTLKDVTNWVVKCLESAVQIQKK